MLAGLTAAPAAAQEGDSRSPVRVVVIDPGHGGEDFGAVGRLGTLEKDLVLELAKELGRRFERTGVRVVYTRKSDAFVSLSERTSIANIVRADLYLSIHANSSENAEAQGPESYFLSIDASDDEALQVALTENRVFGTGVATPDSAEIVGSILGELIRVDHMRVSSLVASAIQRELGDLPGPSRGVKQAPFVVLSGVNMPAVLLEIGFLTNSLEERKLRRASYRERIADAILRAVRDLNVVDRKGLERASVPDQRPERQQSEERE